MRARLLFLVLAGSSLLVPRLGLADCTPVPFCISDVTCTTQTDSQCTACASGFFVNSHIPSTCDSCTPVAHCVTPLTCTSANDSQCGQCAGGYYLTETNGHSACVACTAIAGCETSETCTSASDSQCGMCEPGFYLYEGGQADACNECPGVNFCISDVICTSPDVPQCSACAFGHYLMNNAGSASTCPSCTTIPHCNSPVTCTTGVNSQCTSCALGFHLQDGVQDACLANPDCAPGFFGPSGHEPCTPCAAGTFAAAGRASCSTCAAECGPDQYTITSCSATSDNTCGTCDASCTTCSGPSASECTSCPTGDAPVGGVCAPGCLAAPASGCRLPAASGKAKLDIEDNAKNQRDTLRWTWANGSATTLADFGDPATTDEHFLCIYDGTSRVSSAALPAGGMCGKKPCWSTKKKFYSYRNALLTPDGLLMAKLASGAAGKASIVVSGKGVNLKTPDVSVFSGPIRVQLQRADGGVCFESVFSAPFKRDAKGVFSDVAD